MSPLAKPDWDVWSVCLFRVVVLVMFLSPTLGVHADIAESEPNGTLLSANTVQFDASYRGKVSVAKINPRTELDLYRVTIPTLPTPLSLRIVMTPTSADHALDAWFRILSPAGAFLKEKDSFGDNAQELLDLQVESGATYYIECRSADWSSSGNGDYTLAVALFVPPTIQAAYWVTPNQVLTCFDGTPVTLKARVAGFAVGDVLTFDLYEDELVFDEPVATGSGTVYLEGAELYVSAAWKSKWRADGVADDPEFYFTVTGREVTATSALLHVLPGDPDDRLTEAAPLGPLVSTRVKLDEVGIPDDVDLCSFQVSAGQRITFDVDRPSGALAPTLRLFDSNGSELAKNTGGAGPLESPANEAFIERTFSTAGTFYVGVSGAGNANYNPQTGGSDSLGSTGPYRLTVSPGIAGQVQKPGSSSEYLVDLLRADKPGAPIDSLKTTWVVVHGWNSSRSEPNIAELANALSQARPNDQVLTLDWSSIADSGKLAPEAAAAGIVPVATWAAKALQDAGFFGHRLNIVGHSFGSYVGDEIAKILPGTVNSIVALDPAANAVPAVFDPVSNDEINFMRDAQWSWAFHSSGLGNDYTPARANEAFIVDSNLTFTWDAHSAVVGFFAYTIMHPDDPIGQLFGLDDLLDGQYGPWVLDVYPSTFFMDHNVFAYEAVISAPGGRVPTAITFTTNAPVLLIDSPAPNSVLVQSPVTIRGRASDAGRGNSGIASVLVNGKRAAGDNVSIDGVASWTATAPLKLGINFISVVATDASTPNVGSTTNTLTVVYDPEVIVVPDLAVDEEVALNTNLAADDGELSAKALTYVLGIGPSGLTVSPTGTLAWKPTEAQGPSTNFVELGISDGTVSTRKRFSVIVREVNGLPAVADVPVQTLADGLNLNLSLSATDSDIPAQPLKYALIDGPSGLSVSSTGQVTWNPKPAQRPSTNSIRFSVNDGLASVTSDFQVVLLSGGVPVVPPVVTLHPTPQANQLEIHVRGSAGSEFLIETSETLGGWFEERRIIGQGPDTPVRVVLMINPGAQSKFWRVRPTQ